MMCSITLRYYLPVLLVIQEIQFLLFLPEYNVKIMNVNIPADIIYFYLLQDAETGKWKRRKRKAEAETGKLKS